MINLPPQAERLFGTFNLALPGGFNIAPNYVQAGAVVLLLFVLVLMMGQLRHRLLDWHMKGFLPGIAFGFIMALIIEGFLLVGGKTAFISVLGWENPPAPIGGVIDSGHGKLVELLQEEVSVEKLHKNYQDLDNDQQLELQELICTE